MNIPARQIVAGDVVRIDERTLGVHRVKLSRHPTVRLFAGVGPNLRYHSNDQAEVELEPDELVEVVSMWKTTDRPL